MAFRSLFRLSVLLLCVPLLHFSCGLATDLANLSSFSYELIDGGIAITGYSGTESSLIIPDTIDGYTVLRIGNQAFEQNDTLTQVTLPETLTSIGAYAFHSCHSLTEVIIPSQTSSVSAAAFASCSSLEEITFLHPTCSIYDAPATISECAVIVGYNNSTAQQYATDYSRTFRSLGDAPCTNHSYTSQCTKEPTCTQEGELTYVCSLCGDRYTEVIPAAGHTPVVQEEIPATCTEDGRTSSTRCSVCGETLAESEVISALGHSPITEQDTPATCTTPGHTGATVCSVCGILLTESEPIPATGHNCSTVTTPATPKADGHIDERCTVCGTTVSTKTIAAPKTLTLSRTLYTYNRSQRTPSVSVSDRRGISIPSSHYTVSYPKSRSNVGIYTVQITFLGSQYSGTMKTTFRIRPASTKLRSLTGKSRGLKITWYKQTTQTSGYQLQYCTRSSFPKSIRHTVTVSGKSSSSKTISKLKANKTYYVRIRTYKTMSDKTRNYSAWSSVKSQKTKR